MRELVEENSMLLAPTTSLVRDDSTTQRSTPTQFLVKDPAKRLHKLEEIKKQPFFSEIDWEKMEKKQIEVPWKPDITVNAKGIMEIEECNDDDVYRNVTVAAEDVIADFDFVGAKYHRRDLSGVLAKKYAGKLDDLPDPAEPPAPAGGCCVIV